MILVDNALEKRAQAHRPIRVGLVGAGYIGQGIAQQIVSHVPGMTLAAISNRTVAKGEAAYALGTDREPRRVREQAHLDAAIEEGRPAVTDDPSLLCASGAIDAIIEATGEIEFGAEVALTALDHRKHLVLMNAELDATVGPILKVKADEAGVVLTNTDGDQPGVVMNLLRFVRSIGYRPVLAGNVKGLIDPYRTPETQRAFAAAHGQGTKMITSFADGTKLAMEMAIVANATGFGVGQRGMYGPACDHAEEAGGLFPEDQLLNGGLVDYVLGAEPGPGVFVIGYNDNPTRKPYMEYFKMGTGPFYVFYTPYHLPHLEAPLTVARAVDFADAAVAAQGGPVCEVVTVAKTDLAADTRLDGIGGFHTYGVLDNAATSRRENLLPMGLSEDAILKRACPIDQPLTFDDVTLPDDRLVDALWTEQHEHFTAASSTDASSVPLPA
jgi:predicted homoserine dehydrogenase-like protein